MEPPGPRSDQDVAAARRVLMATDARPELNRIARLAARLLGAASAQVSLLTEVQTIVGGAGLPAELLGEETPLSESLCTVTASCGEPLVVPDARADSRVAALPPVASGAVGSYLGVPLVVEDGRIVGALCVFDVSPRTWSPTDPSLLEQLAESAGAELELAVLSGEYATSRARWGLAIAAAGIGSFDWDLVTGQLAWDETLKAMFGYDDRSFGGTIEAYRARVHPDDLARTTETVQEAIAAVGAYSVEHRIRLPSGETRWVQASGRAVADETGKAVRLMGAASDATARRTAQDLVQLSARAAQQLSSSLDIDAAAATLAELVVPLLADWSLVSVIGPDGLPRSVATRHVDPVMREVLARHAGARLCAIPDPDPEPVPDSAVVLPLTARGRLVGVLSLCREPDRVAMTGHERQIAVATAERAGLAIDNIRLYAEQRAAAEQLRDANEKLQAAAAHDRTVARALQDAMLTRLPEPDHLHLVARYLTATGTEQVGGDWYDAVVLPGGATTVMIGDVAGHDITAAAAMGQLRNMLRAFAWDRPDDPPSTIVHRLDRATHELGLTTFATLVLLRVEQDRGDEPHGMRTLHWTNAGHPPPVLVHADGTVAVLDVAHDLLLGAMPDAVRHDHTHAAPPGSTLVLYTDGLIETRTADIDAGQERLLDRLRAHHRLPPGEMLDAVLADMVGSQPDDDVAILAVRFHPEDEARPAEAGPRRD